jgi:exosortase/archaeosortase family protein
LSLSGFVPQVQGDLVVLPGFTVRIVTECTPLYACLLYCAFVLAQPSTWLRTLSGLLVGILVITAANLLRIAFITAAGTILAPILFDILHVYLGQVAMLILVVTAALAWLRWSAGGPAPLPFLLRAGFYATLFFVPWLSINRTYVEYLDFLVAQIFSILYPGYQLLTPRPLPIYNHTFAVPLFLALVLASRYSWTWRRLAATGGGVAIIALWHTLFRVSHVVWTALHVTEIMALHQAIYLGGQFLLPFLLWLLLGGHSIRQGTPPSPVPVRTLLLPFLLAFSLTVPAYAEPGVIIHPTGRGGFAIKGENFNHVTEAEIQVDYKSVDDAVARVSGAGLGAKATVVVQADTPGTFTLRLKSLQPLNGHVQLATAQSQGSITFLTAWLRNDKGMTETPRITIKNPTDEELNAMAERHEKKKSSPVVAPPITAAVAATTNITPAVIADLHESSASGTTARHQPETDVPLLPVSFSRRTSVFERFRSYSGERTDAALVKLFERNDDLFSQAPPVLLSDGVAALLLTVRASGKSERAPQFFITGGNCTGLASGSDGEWVLEIVPEAGSLTSSVSVLVGNEMIEFPLAVSPPLDLFDSSVAGEGVADYVAAANRLAAEINKLGNYSLNRKEQRSK